MKWIRYGIAIGIVAATIIGANQAAKTASMQSAQSFYAEQRYIADRDIQFSPGGLQEYSAEIVTRSSEASRLAQSAVSIFGFSLASIVVLAPNKSVMKQRFETWQQAVKSGDNHAIAKIELEVQDERIN